MTYDGYTAAAEIANMGAYVLALLLPAVLYCRRIRIPTYNAFPLSQPRDTRIALAAIPITLMTVVVGAYTASAMSVFFAAFGLYPTSPVSAVPTGVVPFVLYFLSSAVLPAIVEELVFRGVIQQLAQPLGRWQAAALQAVLFAVQHGTPAGMAWALGCGLVLGALRERTGRVWPGMLLHTLNNLLVFAAG